ncbi:hypothetical protein AAV94_11600 [Lampropedia cohaerens]|uniref:Glycosyl transferase family 1 n=1 Tax=Lampropedia cohaerens TaxID=1610491 RepID=A0A0U1PXN6_9BURK|nr:glycosyltransferase [Lampropedia cohaerens]KKW67227.1 hypothetical protein AAV94_11600 [Lampropedia cohaerens]
MRILFVVTGLGLGGAERQVVDLADRLQAAGHNVGIAHMVDETKVLPKHEQVRLFPLRCSRSLSGMVRGYMRLRRLIRLWRPDVVHSHMVHANILTRLVRLSCRIPRLVCTAHNTNEGGRIWMWAYRLTDALADVNTNVSREAVRAFEEKGAVRPGRMLAVYNGIDTRRFAPDATLRQQMRLDLSVQRGQRVLLALGRLTPSKGHDILLNVFARLYRDDPSLLLWIGGEGASRQALQQQIETLGLHGRALLLGARDDVPALLNAADLFVLPSRFEGFGLVVAEAMACEKLVVATDAGGVAEVMGDVGWLVPVENPDALHSALQAALQTPAERMQQIGQAGRARIQAHFGLDAALQTWQHLYRGESA